MKNNNKLALVVSFYLSKYDKSAYRDLGYSSFSQAFKEIGSILNVPANTIKNMRENFDPLHENNRVGWYQRELSPSRINVLENYGYLSKDALTEIVKEILNNYKKKPENLNVYLNIIKDEEEIEKSKYENTRGITGHRAEEIFKKAFEEGAILDFSGELQDKRHNGCGYDFELNTKEGKVAFEVKGLFEAKGGINFTDKEWATAREMMDNYIVVLVSNIKSEPEFSYYINPYNTFEPQKRIVPTITVNWSVSSTELF